MIDTRKRKPCDLRALEKKGLLVWPIPAMEFVQTDHDKKEYWLEAWTSETTLRTSVSISDWGRFSDKSKLGLIRYIKKALWGAPDCPAFREEEDGY